MANPFSGTITGKNTEHTNQANLVYALIPRSTTVVKEIITNTNATISGGTVASYDADGYIIGTNTTNVFAELAITGLAQSGSYTIIGGFKNFSTSGGSSPVTQMYKNSEPWVYAGIQLDTGSVRGRPSIKDGSDFTPAFATFTNSHVGIAGKSSPGAQGGGYVQGTSSPPAGTYTTYTGTTFTMNGGTMDRLAAVFNVDWGFQYFLVYNAYLSDANIEAIIENPGNVLSYESASVPLSVIRPSFVNFQPGFGR